MVGIARALRSARRPTAQRTTAAAAAAGGRRAGQGMALTDGADGAGGFGDASTDHTHAGRHDEET